MTYTKQYEYKCPVDWSHVTHTITFQKADQIHLFEDVIFTFSCSRNGNCTKCAENYRD